MTTNRQAPSYSTPDRQQILHASCVAFDGQAALIVGAAGRGKSALALQLIALGALLVADDRTILADRSDHVQVSAPPTISGLIEAHGVGILNAPPAGPARLRLVVDMDEEEKDRLPELRHTQFMGYDFPALRHVPKSHFPAAVLQYLKFGRNA